MSDTETDIFGFEKLEVWQKAMAFAVRLYELTGSLPHQEMFGMTTQVRRAGVSIVANIAEGNSRSTGKDKARFFEIAYGSLSEVGAILRIAEQIGSTDAQDLASIRYGAARIGRMLSGLKRAVLREEQGSDISNPSSLVSHQEES